MFIPVTTKIMYYSNSTVGLKLATEVPSSFIISEDNSPAPPMSNSPFGEDQLTEYSLIKNIHQQG